MAMGVQGQLIEAAAKVGVKWILPTEYAGDGLNEGMAEAVPLFHPKREARRQIEELSKEYEGLRWIGVATGPWLEAVSSLFCLFYLVVLSLWLLERFLFIWSKERKKNPNSSPSTKGPGMIQRPLQLTQHSAVNPTLPLCPKPPLPHRNPLPRRRALQHRHLASRRSGNRSPPLPSHFKSPKPPCLAIPLR
jgi:hypothetical protein